MCSSAIPRPSPASKAGWCGSTRSRRVRSAQVPIVQRRDVLLGRLRREAAEHDVLSVPASAESSARSYRRRCARQGRRGNDRRRSKSPGTRSRRACAAAQWSSAVPVARRQQILFAFAAAVPHRSDRMDHEARRQPVAARDLRVAGVAAAERAAFRQQLRARRAMDRAIDAAAAEQ